MKIPKIVQEKIANEMYAAAEKDRKGQGRKYLGMSQIGHACSRKLWLDFRGYAGNPIEGRVLMLFRFGDLIEDEIIYFLRGAGYTVDGQQDGFSDFNGYFSGHCDGVVHGVTKQPHILECKSCNAKSFKAFKKKGVKDHSPVYYTQCQAYMGYSGLERALVVVQCKDNSEIYTERIYSNTSEFQELKKKAENILFSDDPPGAVDIFECQWCDQQTNCRDLKTAMIQKPMCANCDFLKCEIDYHSFFCRNEKHAQKIKTWGISCPDWRKI